VLFDPGQEARALTTETAVDRLRARFGPGAVMTGRGLRNAEKEE
jgi:hypothetical protein